VYQDLQFACVVIFCLSVPFGIYIRATRPEVPLWLIVVVPVALGWLLVNAHALFEHLEVDEDKHEVAACFQHPADFEIKQQPMPTISEGGMRETVVENPCPLVDYFWESYQPVRGLIYGPLYLFWCALPYWLLVARKSAPGLTIQIAAIGVATLAIEWAAIGSAGIRTVELDYTLGSRGPFLWPPMTVAIALIVSWIVTTQVIQKYRTH
jgi:hypothetical protein